MQAVPQHRGTPSPPSTLHMEVIEKVHANMRTVL